MKERLIIDTSVFLTYAAYGKLYRLVNAINQYDLEVYLNETLIEEIERNLIKVLVIKTWGAIELMQQIEAATIKIKTVPVFTACPDEKDNFLFDLALQTGTDIIVTNEKALLNWKESPVAIHDLKWFKEKYIVNL